MPLARAGRLTISPRCEPPRSEKPMVALVRELRRKAALCRRAASISTSGSGRTDHILLALAEQLELDAALGEQQLQEDVPALSSTWAPPRLELRRGTL
jgi:hypothetical protein